MVLWSGGKLAQNYSIFCQTAASWRKNLRANSTLLIVWKSRGEWHRICSNSIYPVFTVFVRYHKRWVKGYIYLLAESYSLDLGKLRQVSLELETVCCYLPTTEREKTRKSTNIAHMAYNAVVYKKSGKLFLTKCSLDMVVKHWEFIYTGRTRFRHSLRHIHSERKA